MGIAFQFHQRRAEFGLFGGGKPRSLRVAGSNLLGATHSNVVAFREHFEVSDSETTVQIAHRSARKIGFAGEIFTLWGLDYAAIDPAPGFGTTASYLNLHELPKAFQGAFDLMLNFGTAKPVLNQGRGFHVIHEAT